ncbi:MAG: outer membrane beta-barrel protein, partial [Acidobacteriales bacterium]|nr:outer membrane beta-barrel protein [Terriglobales bacterium]
TGDAGCESGGGVNCTGNQRNAAGQIVSYKQSFLGYMVYNRWWFHKDRYAVTVGGGKINNPGRYLVLLPPIHGATATSGTPYFTENPGDPYKAWDISGTYDYMPSQYITFRWEFNHRHANVPYFTGPGGITPAGGNSGPPGSQVAGFSPDLRKTEDRGTMAILVKF